MVLSSLTQHQSTAWTVGGGLANDGEEPSLLPVPPLIPKTPFIFLFFFAFPSPRPGCGSGRGGRASSHLSSPEGLLHHCHPTTSALSATSKDLIPGCDTSPTQSQPVPTITFK